MDIFSYILGRNAGRKSVSTQTVEELPEEGQADVIYLVPDDNEGVINEYIWEDGDWSLVGTVEISQGGYYPSYSNGTLIFESGSSASVSEGELML